MPDRVPYHHPQDEQFSLDYVNPDRDAVDERIEGYDDDTEVLIESFDLDRTVSVVYNSTGASGDADAIDYDLVDVIDAMNPANSVIATRYVDVFQSVLKANYEEEGSRVQAYKDVDGEAIGRALDQIEWEGTATEVAGRIASNLILKHPLPNANHRSAVGMVQLYLRRVDPRFSMPVTARQLDGNDEYDWMEWVNEYIEDSKRLLTVRRNGTKFHYLEQWGCDVLVRRHGLEIRLAEYELDLVPSARWKRYSNQHEELWIDFVTEAANRADLAELADTAALSKHEFADELKELD